MARLKFDGFSWIDILDTDSYKLSHFKQMPPNTTWMMSYLEARGGEGTHTVFFGLQYIIKRYLQPLLLEWNDWGDTSHVRHPLKRIAEFTANHGLPFNVAGWKRISELGYFPVKIRAVPEGSRIPHGNVLMTVESTDPETFWIVSWLETALQRLWYPINVATLAYGIRTMIQGHLNATSDELDPSFKLHDFGSRGASSQESAAIASMAHLTSFKGTDTVAGLLYAAEYYECPVAGYSIPASEHSTMTMWGRERESDAYENMVRAYGGVNRLFACVSDSYDIFHAVDTLWCGSLADKVRATGGTLVIRPDSGNPRDVCLKVFALLGCNLQGEVTVNSKGYKVLPRWVRVIYGDGINRQAIDDILSELMLAGWSATNIAFGMGGSLVQKHDRDTHRMAFKCCAAEVDGKLVKVFKDPATDPGKASKCGLLNLVRLRGEWVTYSPWETLAEYREATARPQEQQFGALRTVFENGRLLIDENLDAVRERLWPGKTPTISA